MGVLDAQEVEGEERERSIVGALGKMNVVGALGEEGEEKERLMEDNEGLESLVVLKLEVYMEERLIRSASKVLWWKTDGLRLCIPVRNDH